MQIKYICFFLLFFVVVVTRGVFIILYVYELCVSFRCFSSVSLLCVLNMWKSGFVNWYGLLWWILLVWASTSAQKKKIYCCCCCFFFNSLGLCVISLYSQSVHKIQEKIYIFRMVFNCWRYLCLYSIILSR